MGQVDSPYCVKVREFLMTDQRCYIIQEFANGCSLLDLLNERFRQNLGSFSEVEANLVIKQIVTGCKHLYEKEIVHRDLNVKNVLIHYPDMEP
jgi:serine/threonine protein kinase